LKRKATDREASLAGIDGPVDSARDRDVTPGVPGQGEKGPGSASTISRRITTREERHDTRGSNPDDSGSRLTFCCCWRTLSLLLLGAPISQAAEQGARGSAQAPSPVTEASWWNNVHFRTDDEVAPGFHTKKMSNGADKSGRMDNVVFAVGMVVTVRHGKDDNNAQVIEVPGQPPRAHRCNSLRSGQHHRDPRPERSRGRRGDLRLPQARRHRGSQRVRG